MGVSRATSQTAVPSGGQASPFDLLEFAVCQAVSQEGAAPGPGPARAAPALPGRIRRPGRPRAPAARAGGACGHRRLPASRGRSGPDGADRRAAGRPRRGRLRGGVRAGPGDPARAWRRRAAGRGAGRRRPAAGSVLPVCPHPGGGAVAVARRVAVNRPRAGHGHRGPDPPGRGHQGNRGTPGDHRRADQRGTGRRGRGRRDAQDRELQPGRGTTVRAAARRRDRSGHGEPAHPRTQPGEVPGVNRGVPPQSGPRGIHRPDAAAHPAR